jgi:hypothetical protein
MEVELFPSLQNEHNTIFMLLFIILQQVSAAYAGNHQAETHKIIKEKYTLMWRPPLYS